MRARSRVAIVGSGHAAFGVCAVLSRDIDVEIDVFDIGLNAPYPGQHDVPVANAKSFDGSYFPYGIRDTRWPIRLQSERICSSHAYGGFGTVYSGAVLAPNKDDLVDWPADSIPDTADYAAIAGEFKLLGERNALKQQFPLVPSGAPSLFSGSHADSAGWGWSQVALQPHSPQHGLLPFNPARFFDQLRATGRIRYQGAHYVTHVDHDSRGVRVHSVSEGVDITSDRYDAVFLGAGCVNSTGVVHRSCCQGREKEYHIQSTGGFVQGFVGQGPALTPELSERRDSNLPEVFLEIRGTSFGGYQSHTQISAINKYVIDTISQRVPAAVLGPLRGVLGSFHFAITSVHSRLSSRSVMVCSAPSGKGGAGAYGRIQVDEVAPPYVPAWREVVRGAIRQLRSELRLRHVPGSEQLGNLLRGNRLGGWHFGGTIPMSTSETPSLSCTAEGEVREMPSVFLVDSASFPSIPGTTVALLTMAHGARVARRWVESRLG